MCCRMKSVVLFDDYGVAGRGDLDRRENGDSHGNRRVVDGRENGDSRGNRRTSSSKCAKNPKSD